MSAPIDGAPREPVFLTAAWRHLVMLNYEVDPALLAPLVPPATQLDGFGGRTYASVVGFLFLGTRVRGVPMPFHRNFEEVNLRFYVRRDAEGETRRGVVFVREIVPRRAIAWVARARYGENYVRAPMRHAIGPDRSAPREIEYAWRWHGLWHRIRARVGGDPVPTAGRSLEEFLVEHYFGYARQKRGGTLEYRVEHPRWRAWRALEATLDCDVASVYGPAWAGALGPKPACAFVAEGSLVAVRRGRLI